MRTAQSSGVEQPGPVGDDDAAGGQVDLGDERLDERHERVLAAVAAYDEQVLRARVEDVGDHADAAPSVVTHVEPDQLVVVELLGVLGRLVGVDRSTVSSSPRAASAAVAVRELGEPDAAACPGASGSRRP